MTGSVCVSHKALCTQVPFSGGEIGELNNSIITMVNPNSVLPIIITNGSGLQPRLGQST